MNTRPGCQKTMVTSLPSMTSSAMSSQTSATTPRMPEHSSVIVAAWRLSAFADGLGYLALDLCLVPLIASAVAREFRLLAVDLLARALERQPRALERLMAPAQHAA